MKNLSLILNAVLLVAVGVLYVMQFSSSDTTTSEEVDQPAASGEFVIAYINSDTLTAKYQFVLDEGEKLRKRSEQLDQDNKSRVEGLQKELADYQSNYGNLTIGQARTIEENLAQKEQNLRLFQENSRLELIQLQNQLAVDVYTRLTDYLKVYSADNGIQMVVKYDPNSDVLFAGEGLDITDVVVENLNAEYANPVTQPADSTATN